MNEKTVYPYILVYIVQTIANSGLTVEGAGRITRKEKKKNINNNNTGRLIVYTKCVKRSSPSD